MTVALTTVKWTVKDYHRMIEAGVLAEYRAELLQGEIVEMAPEGMPHAHLSSSAADYIRARLAGRVKVRDASEPEPDLAIVADLGDVYLEHHPYGENIFWLVEYADASLRKDMEVKRKLYGEAGIAEYWVVDLKRMELLVFAGLEQGGYKRRQVLTVGQVRPITFPKVSFAVDRFIRR